jgi:hypothetical protein
VTGTRIRIGLGLVAGLFALAACDGANLRGSPVPPPRPALADSDASPQSEDSKALQRYYARVQQDLLTRGLLRRDGGGPDTPFTRRQLVENFIRVAMYEEFTSAGGKLVARQTESRLHRWERPVRMRIVFGNSVPLEQRDKDRAAIVSYARRLSRVTGLPIIQSPIGANYTVFVVNQDERQTLGPKLRAIIPDIDQSAIDTVQGMPRSTLCLVFARDNGSDAAYTEAVAVIPAEHPDLLRLSCIHEELAQGLGLPNDSPQARPSIFNDDEEFGLLTTQDELMLRMLYDRRMRPGMTISQARPVAEVIAAELLGGES